MAQFAASAGGTVTAGLPNISGNVQLATGSGNLIIGTTSGVFYGFNPSSAMPTFAAASLSTLGNSVLQFDASKSNALYGASTTVQPPAINVIPCMKY